MSRRPFFATLALTTIALIAVTALTGCGGAGGSSGVAGVVGPSTPGTGTNPPSGLNTAVYSLTLSGVSTISSVVYDDGRGNLVTVTNPTSGWTVSVPVSRGGGSVEAHARGTLPSRASATLRASWQVPGESPENEVETETNIHPSQTETLSLDVRKRLL